MLRFSITQGMPRSNTSVQWRSRCSFYLFPRRDRIHVVVNNVVGGAVQPLVAVHYHLSTASPRSSARCLDGEAQRGYRPTAIRRRRSTTRLSRLSFRSRAVASPSSVSGSITAPRSTKWSPQRWRRGWKKLTSTPLRGSTVPMSLPFHALHRMQAYARLPASDDPPCLRLTMWSI